MPLGSRTLLKTKEGYIVHHVNDPTDPTRDMFWHGYKHEVRVGAGESPFRYTLAQMLTEKSHASGVPLPELVAAFANGDPIDLPMGTTPTFPTVQELVDRFREVENNQPLVAQALLADLP